MLADVIYLVGLLIALCVAFRFTNRRMVIVNQTATVLICGAAVAAALPIFGVPFDDLLSFAIDMAMIVLILRGHYSTSDSLIVALFVPCWALYTQDGPTAHSLVTLIATLQFLLTTPLSRVIQRNYLALRKKIETKGGHLPFRPVSST